MSNPTCTLCGAPMPVGEEMFKFHGFSGPCPKPPLASRPAPLPSAEPVAGMNLIEVAPPWVIFFEDQSVRPVFYRGTEADARAVLAHYETQWACHLYVSASAIARTTPPAAAQDTAEVTASMVHTARMRAAKAILALSEDAPEMATDEEASAFVNQFIASHITIALAARAAGGE